MNLELRKAGMAMLLGLGLALNAAAEITATVYPGYQFSANERPTTAALNLLGRPTIYITGTLGGTNVALGANSVTTTMMSDTLPGTNLSWDASSPRKLVIADSGVDTNQIAVGIAGLGLGGGGGAPLSNKTDNVYLQITNDVLTISLSGFTNLIGAISTNVANTYARYYATNYPVTNSFVSYTYAVADGLIANTNHSLGATPRHVEWRLVCATTDAGYAVGDEILASSLNGDDDSVFILGANATNVFAVCGGLSNIRIKHKSTGATANFTEANWGLKCYATP